jgi:GGDEF domain-containing protein
MKPLLMPGIFLLVLAALLHTGLFVPAAALAGYTFFAACLAGLLLAWRFHSIRIFLALLVLCLAHQTASIFALITTQPARIALVAIGILVPLDFVLFTFVQEKPVTFTNLASPGAFLFVQSVFVAVVCRPAPFSAASRPIPHILPSLSLPFSTQLCFSIAAVIVFIRYFLFRKPSEAGLLWALCACLLALHSGGAGRISTSYFAAAALVLAGAVIETSYLLAYHDELTTLPSRRAFNDAAFNLAPPYSIAMVDIDHFKRCNDTYGHDTGDQILRLVASKLGRVSGGGVAYRCGGEEFAILFAGKKANDVLNDLETLRLEIATASLRLRGAERRQQPRGPDRRNQKSRGRIPKGHAIRQLTKQSTAAEISVTISIGVANSESDEALVRNVIQAADKALYRAKAAGRNRVEMAFTSRKRIHQIKAGIA